MPGGGSVPAAALWSQHGQTEGVCFSKDGKQSDEKLTGGLTLVLHR